MYYMTFVISLYIAFVAWMCALSGIEDTKCLHFQK